MAGVFSQGRTREEARTNVIDALRLMLPPEPSEASDQREREAPDRRPAGGAYRSFVVIPYALVMRAMT